MKSDFFGYVPYRFTVEFKEGKISPVENFDEVAAWIDEYKNQDGFIYPPIENRVWLDIRHGNKKEVPKSKRPALLHRIPASHKLSLSSSDDREKIRKGPGSFIIHLLAYFFGVRLQFYDWWFDGRVPIKSTHNVHFRQTVVENFISYCYQIWRKWREPEQKRITNILYMHSRALSYEWDWEQFMIEYTVLDGCWNLSKSLYNLKQCRHEDRIHVLCEKFDIPADEKRIHDIVQLRNDLFHETFWDKSQPCTATYGPGFASSLNLRKFNQRLIPAVIGYKTSYIKTKWWQMGTFLFEKENNQ